MLNMQDKMNAVRNKVQECIRIAESKLNIKLPHIDIRFDLKGRAAGMAGYNGFGGWTNSREYYVRFNVQHMALGGKSWEHLLNDTVPHEIAHTVCQSHPQFGRNHDAGWKRICILLGGNGTRCYTADDAPEAIAKQRPFTYISTAGATISVTPAIHRKIQAGAVYTVKKGGGKLTKECAYHTTTPALVKAPKTKEVPVSTFNLPNSASKADLIRAMIRNGMSQDEIVARAVTELGMSRSLAKTYVKNNWNKA